MNDDVLQQLLAAKDVASRCVSAFRERRAAAALDMYWLAGNIRAYILAKYHLDEDECPNDSMGELGQQSIEKLLAHGVSLDDTSANCDGADSATVKQAYLMMALQEDYDVKLDGFKVAFAETTRDIAQLVWEQLS